MFELKGTIHFEDNCIWLLFVLQFLETYLLLLILLDLGTLFFSTILNMNFLTLSPLKSVFKFLTIMLTYRMKYPC